MGKDKDILLKWTIHLGKKYPNKLAVSIIAVLFVFIVALISYGIGLAVIAAIILLASISEFVFPVSYTITTESASSTCLFRKTEINWENVRNYYLDDDGIKLSPLKTKSRMEVFRGVYLRFDNNKEQIIQKVKQCRDAKPYISK
ncbi:MAG: hypothetical protein SNJ70_06230 [Armatimonadota bacterium]